MGYVERREKFVEGKHRTAHRELGDDPDFEDYLEPHGKYDLPVYTGLPNDHEIIPRILSRRREFLEAEYDLDERYAVAIAGMEMGLPASWVADHLDVTTGTVSNYHERIHEEFGPGVYAQAPFTDLGRELETGWPDLRTCPKCDKEAVESRETVERVYNNSGEILDEVADDDTHVCSSCGLGLELQLEVGDDGED